MQLLKTGLCYMIAVILLPLLATLGAGEKAEAELHWQPPKKEAMRLRLVALALAYPRSSFFATHEVFVAEKQLGRDEWRLVKLVYGFLPYQARLSESGLDYSIVHELRAVRDPSCDETLRQMTYPRNMPEWPQPDQSWKYSTDSPSLNPDRPRHNLPCYQTTADDYGKPLHEPVNHSKQF